MSHKCHEKKRKCSPAFDPCSTYMPKIISVTAVSGTFTIIVTGTGLLSPLGTTQGTFTGPTFGFTVAATPGSTSTMAIFIVPNGIVLPAGTMLRTTIFAPPCTRFATTTSAIDPGICPPLGPSITSVTSMVGSTLITINGNNLLGTAGNAPFPTATFTGTAVQTTSTNIDATTATANTATFTLPDPLISGNLIATLMVQSSLSCPVETVTNTTTVACPSTIPTITNVATDGTSTVTVTGMNLIGPSGEPPFAIFSGGGLSMGVIVQADSGGSSTSLTFTLSPAPTPGTTLTTSITTDLELPCQATSLPLNSPVPIGTCPSVPVITSVNATVGSNIIVVKGLNLVGPNGTDPLPTATFSGTSLPTGPFTMITADPGATSILATFTLPDLVNAGILNTSFVVASSNEGCADQGTTNTTTICCSTATPLINTVMATSDGKTGTVTVAGFNFGASPNGDFTGAGLTMNTAGALVSVTPNGDTAVFTVPGVLAGTGIMLTTSITARGTANCPAVASIVPNNSEVTAI